jgi:hypothetical protein
MKLQWQVIVVSYNRALRGFSAEKATALDATLTQ